MGLYFKKVKWLFQIEKWLLTFKDFKIMSFLFPYQDYKLDPNIMEKIETIEKIPLN